MKPRYAVLVVLGLTLTVARPASASTASLTFSAPTNNVPKTIAVQITPTGGALQNVVALINPGTSVQIKRNLVMQALNQAGFQTTPDPNPAKCNINNLANGTAVTLMDQGTGETKDTVQTAGLLSGSVSFQGTFSGFDYLHQPAIFTAGVVTRVGELTAQVSASELNFQTDGPIICQALFQRLAPRAPQYGAQINYAGDRLEVYFDPAYTVTQGAIIFGTTSPTPGDFGTINLPQPAYPSIPQGNDLWSTDHLPVFQFGGPDLPPIPADFFYPGSQPFIGSVLFGGKAIDPVAGGADTIVQRMSSCNLPSIGSTATVPIEMIALNLKSVEPISVSGSLWNVTVSLLSPQPSGTMTVTRSYANGGTFSSDLPVRPLLVFTPVGGGADRTWDPGSTIHLNSGGSTNWCDSAVLFAQSGGGPGFFPCAMVSLSSPGSSMTQEPALANGQPVGSPPLDANADRLINGGDLQLLVEAYLAGPTHPKFSSMDLNANGVSDAEDVTLAVNAFLTWPSTVAATGDWVGVESDCDYKHHVISVCKDVRQPDPLRTRFIAVRAADKDGNPSVCPVKFRLYNCEGVGANDPVEVEPGDNQCIAVPENLALEAWCKSTINGACRMSIKEVKICP